MNKWILNQTGLRSALGPGAQWALPAARAGITRPADIDFTIVDEEDEEQNLIGYPAFGPFEGFYQFGLWSHLGAAALEDLLLKIPDRERLYSQVQFFLSAPRPSMERTLWDLEQENPFDSFLVSPLLDLCSFPVPASNRRFTGCGAEGGWLGLSTLMQLPPSVDQCIQLGVDSLSDYESVEWLANQNRLKSPDQPNGIMPGQAATCLFWTRNRSDTNPSGLSLQSVYTLPGKSIFEESPSETGKRLATCIQQVLQNASKPTTQLAKTQQPFTVMVNHAGPKPGLMPKFSYMNNLTGIHVQLWTIVSFSVKQVPLQFPWPWPLPNII